MKLNRKRAFTLIELLITIAIIGILATVVMINLTGSRYRANYTKVLTDMKSIEISAKLYNDENKAWPTESTDPATYAANLGVYLPTFPISPCSGYSYNYRNIPAVPSDTTGYVGVYYIKAAGLKNIYYLDISNFAANPEFTVTPPTGGSAIDSPTLKQVNCKES